MSSLSAQKSSLFGNAGKKKSDSGTAISTTSKPTIAAKSTTTDHASSKAPQASSSSSSSSSSSTTSAMKVPTTTGVSAHNGTGGLTSTQKAKKLEEAKEFMDKAAQVQITSPSHLVLLCPFYSSHLLLLSPFYSSHLVLLSPFYSSLRSTPLTQLSLLSLSHTRY